VDHAQPGKISVLRAEGPVEDVHIVNQFWSQALQRSEIALTMSLRPLILLKIVNQDFQPAIHPTMVEIESKAANL
jgi:hypothetical protein